MDKASQPYEGLRETATQSENPTLIERLAHWIRNFLENAE